MVSLERRQMQDEPAQDSSNNTPSAGLGYTVPENEDIFLHSFDRTLERLGRQAAAAE